jgi:putative transposase
MTCAGYLTHPSWICPYDKYNLLRKSIVLPLFIFAKRPIRLNWRHLTNAGKQLAAVGLQRLETQVKAWTKPTSDRQIAGVVADLFRSKEDLVVENAYLRQQVIVLKRQIKGRPALTPHDRRVLVLLASQLKGWQAALHLVQPETVLKWHREGFRLYWRRRSRNRARQPRLAPETIALIKAMAIENRLWGAPRIRDELKKVGIKVSKRSVQKYMRQARRGLPPVRRGQTWATFLANHGDEIWACDFVQTYDLFFRTIFIFFVVELGSRRVVHFNVTRGPSDGWLTQQLREATSFGEKPRFLICDNDDKYGAQFEGLAEHCGIDVIHTPVRAPKANAICERFMGSVRRELLDHILIVSERQLYRLVREYAEYFNRARPHQGLGSRIPHPRPGGNSGCQAGPILAVPVLGGLHHDYRRAA